MTTPRSAQTRRFLFLQAAQDMGGAIAGPGK